MIFFSLFLLTFLLSVSSETSEVSSPLTIFTPLDLAALNRHVNFGTMQKALEQSIRGNPSPLNDLNHFSSVLRAENPCPLRERVLLKMSRGETVRILVVGGSITKGHGLSDTRSRWSDVLSRNLNGGGYAGRFEVTNVARGAWGVHIWAQRVDELAKFSPDVIFFDLTANEMSHPEQELSRIYQAFVRALDTLPTRPALFFNLMFTLHPTYFIFEHEGINNYTLPLIGGESKNAVAYYKYWKVSDASRSVLNYHKIPSTSFRDLIYPDFFSPPDDLLKKWNDYIHPSEHTHKYIADNLFFSFLYMMQDAAVTEKCTAEVHGITNLLNHCDKTSYIDSKDYDPRASPVCDYGSTISLMQATTSEDSLSSFNMGSNFQADKSIWKFYPDSRSKFGWIYDSSVTYSNDSSIFNSLKYDDIDPSYILSFDIDVKSALQITYLKSYPYHFGNFIVWFDDNYNNTIEISTRWAHELSLPSVYTILFEDRLFYDEIIPDRIILKNISKGKHTLNILPVRVKFGSIQQLKVKILGIKTC